ncbi:MAG: succinyldiaminopimelate transaminase [Thioalkalispiraceae bacterium]|jgi:N-succinyldiaminopimelate aminotransferase
MNPDLSRLHAYPFEKLARLKADCFPPADLEHIPLSIGEPKHPAPDFVLQALRKNLASLSSYPMTKGMDHLRETIAAWLSQRFKLKNDLIDPQQHILPVNGTREALFAIAQTIINRTEKPLVLMPNPFYQIYEGATLLAGAEPYYMNTTAETDFIPDFEAISDKVWTRCQMLYICSPGNPTGQVIPIKTLQSLIQLADKHNFIIASDECYSELYFDEQQPPPGLLQAAYAMGNTSFKNCLVFHSLSKRSNLPGLRSGFVAGDALIMEQFYRYRTYHGCAMPPAHQYASIAAWSDEKHVQENRRLYREKFQVVIEILEEVLPVTQPEASFYLWPDITHSGWPGDDESFARALFDAENVTVLPGQYLAREAGGINPGTSKVRMALVAELDKCREAAVRIRRFIENCATTG